MQPWKTVIVFSRVRLAMPPVRVDLGSGPPLDSLGREVLERDLAEVRQDVVAEDRVVVADRGRLALAVLVDVAQVLRAGVGDSRAGADHAGQRAGGGLDEQAAEPGLGGALGPVARRRTTARGPGRSDRLLHLAAVGQAVLGSPGRAGACPRSGRRARRSAAPRSSPEIGRERQGFGPLGSPTFGTHSGHDVRAG